MHDWQVPIVIDALAEIAKIAAMNTANAQKVSGVDLPYKSEHFDAVVSNIESLADQARR